jgi:hypothetical protein
MLQTPATLPTPSSCSSCCFHCPCCCHQAIDANKDGYIRFDEFATWWAVRKGLVKEAKPTAAAGSK